MNKIISYIITGIGIILLLLSFKGIQKALSITLTGISSTAIAIIGAVITAIGLYFISRFSNPKVSEVPIYEGKNVVGYRRVK